MPVGRKMKQNEIGISLENNQGYPKWTFPVYIENDSAIRRGREDTNE